MGQVVYNILSFLTFNTIAVQTHYNWKLYMNIFNFLISVKVKGHYVKITGINTDKLSKVFSYHLGDQRFFKGAFDTSFRSVTFHEFYLPDVYYILSNATFTARSSYKTVLLRIISEMDKHTWTSMIGSDVTKELNFKAIKDFNYSPMDYQREFLEYYDKDVIRSNLKGALLAATPGSGKTYTTLLLSEMLRADRVIVICPLNAIRKAWERELHTGYKRTPSYYLSVNDKPYQNEKVAIYHYEALNKLNKDIDVIAKAGKVVIILDESHNFNNIKSKRSQLLIDIIERSGSEDIVFASGTPVKAIGNELTVLFKAIDKSYHDDVSAGFNRIFNKGSSEGNLKLLNAKLGKLTFKVDKSRMTLADPNMIEQLVKIDNSKEYTLPAVKEKMEEYAEEREEYYLKVDSEYQESFDDIIDRYRSRLDTDNSDIYLLDEYVKNVKELKTADNEGRLSTFTHRDLMVVTNQYENNVLVERLNPVDKKELKRVSSVVKYPSLKIRGEVLGTVLTRERINCFNDVAAALDIEGIIEDAEKKTVIFSSYVDVCENVSKRLQKSGYNTADVYGKMTKKLDKSVASFNTDATVNPIIATFDSLSTAVPLTIANVVVFINSPYREYIKLQALSRVHRLGADTPVFIYDVLLDTEEPNLTTRGIDIMRWSQDQDNLIMGEEIDPVIAAECLS